MQIQMQFVVEDSTFVAVCCMIFNVLLIFAKILACDMKYNAIAISDSRLYLHIFNHENEQCPINKNMIIHSYI